MRMKKEKSGHVPGQRHSSAANYELNPQTAMLHDHSDEYVLDLFERMLVSKTEMCVVSFLESHIYYLLWTAKLALGLFCSQILNWKSLEVMLYYVIILVRFCPMPYSHFLNEHLSVGLKSLTSSIGETS